MNPVHVETPIGCATEDRPSIAVVLVNWNSGNLLRRCLQSLQRQSLAPDCVFVVDNNSEDGSLNCLKDFTELPIELLTKNKNLGFAGANNLAIEQANGFEFVALLNVDAEASADWLLSVTRAAKRQPNYGSYASCMLMTEKPLRYDGAGDNYHVSGIAWRRHHARSFVQATNTECDVFAPCAGAAVYRRAALLEVGLFDDDFFCYFEDVDIGFRLQLAGYPCLYVHDATVHHIGGGLVKQAALPVYYGHRNLVWTYFKNMPLTLLLTLLPAHILMNIACAVVLTLRGQGAAIWKAKKDALRGIPSTWAKRHCSPRRISTLELLRRMVWLPKLGSIL